MEILIISIIFLVLLLLILWRPYFKQSKNDGSGSTQQERSRKETNISLYQEHKAEIEKDFNEGSIDQESYDYLLAELDQSLLQDIQASEKTLDDLEEHSADKSKAFGVIWPIGLSLFIIIFSVVLYQKEGAYTQLTQVKAQGSTQADQQGHEDARREQMMNYLNELKKEVEKEPDNSEAWYTIGQTLVSIGLFDAAINAYNQVIRIEGESADLFGVKAQAYYYNNDQQMDEQVQSLIDQALTLDPNDPATNILVGMHSFINQQYQMAIDSWQRVLSSNKVGVNKEALQEAVEEAKKRLALTDPQQQPAQMSAQSNQVEGTNETLKAKTSPQIKLRVSLSAEVADKLSKGEDKVVFIYAVPTNGQRMPLAAVKLKSSELPVTIILSDEQAMTPQSALSGVANAHIYAVVSDKGGVGIKAGDYKAQALNVDVQTKDMINLIVSELVE